MAVRLRRGWCPHEEVEEAPQGLFTFSSTITAAARPTATALNARAATVRSAATALEARGT